MKLNPLLTPLLLSAYFLGLEGGAPADASFSVPAAPFDATFYQLDVSVFSQNVQFFLQQGLGPQTLSVYGAEGKVLMSGSFQKEVTLPAPYGLLMTASEFDTWIQAYDAQGYRPRELSVVVDLNQVPRFSSILEIKKKNEVSYTYLGLEDGDYDENFTHLLSQGFRVQDHFAYLEKGVRKHAVTFVNDGQEFFYSIYGYNAQDYQNFSMRMLRLGYRPTSLQVEDFHSEDQFGGVFMKMPGSWISLNHLSLDEYRQKLDELEGQGYRLWKVQGYHSSSLFSAIWTKL